MEKQWYYQYDENYNYVGATFSDKVPENATALAPIGFADVPKFNLENEKWEGNSSDAFSTLFSGSSNGQSASDLIANLTQQVAMAQLSQAKTNAGLIQQNAELIKQVAALQSEKETTNG